MFPDVLFASREKHFANNMEISAKFASYSAIFLEADFILCESSNAMWKLAVREALRK